MFGSLQSCRALFKNQPPLIAAGSWELFHFFYTFYIREKLPDRPLHPAMQRGWGKRAAQAGSTQAHL
jgi:hypothetical protein